MNLERYSRQTLFSGIGERGQKKLLESSIILIGCGGLGCTIANNLARAGVGRIRIVDKDIVELTDLQRQILFDEEDVKKKMPKARVAVDKLRRINSSIQLEAEVCEVEPRNIENLIEGGHLVLDGTDNMKTRFLINEACIKNKIPWIYGGVFGSTGMSMTVIPEKTPCLTCVFGEFPSFPELGTIPLVNAAPITIASWQTTEALKILVGNENLNPDLVYVDLWPGTFRRITIKRRKDCPTCIGRKFELLEAGKQ